MGIGSSSPADLVIPYFLNLGTVKALFLKIFLGSSVEITRQVSDPGNRSKIAEVIGAFIVDEVLKFLPGGTTLYKFYSRWNQHDKM